MSPADEDLTRIGEAIRTRVMVAYALCAIAESEAHAGEMTMVRETVRVIRGIVRELGFAITEPLRVPASAVQELAEFSRELARRIGSIEAAIHLPN